MEKGRILIVDDQEDILQSMEGILSDEGHDVITAKDGQEALHLVQSDAPDIVFLDIWIPGIDGMQTLKAIKKVSPECTVIMMSGHGTIETAVKAIKLGAADYLEKPLNLEDVLHLVQRAVAEKSSAGSRAEGQPASRGLIIGVSPTSRKLRRELADAASQARVLWLHGDEGTGKEFAARHCHYSVAAEGAPLVKVRCQDLTAENIEDIILGRSTDVPGQQNGKLARAGGGTLLLLRIDRTPAGLVDRLADMVTGEHSPTDRIIVTSLKEPSALTAAGDLSPEHATVLGERVVRIPSLRERAEDIPAFLDHFLQEAVDEFEKSITGFGDEALDRLLEYSWPGNIKELKILVEHVVMTAPGPVITAKDLLMPGEKTFEESGVAPDGGRSRNLSVEVIHAPAPSSESDDTVEGLADGAELSGRVNGYRHQRSLRSSAVMYGQGLHSGAKTGLTLSPLPPGSGIVFGHITDLGRVHATLNNVESTGFATSLKSNGLSVRTIEHLMAVFHVYGLTNVLVKISGEVPIMDGSAVEFCDLVESAEIIPQDELVEEIRPTEPIELPVNDNGGKSLRIEPSDRFEIEYFLEYPHPVGSMHVAYVCESPEDFKRNIAPARTFGWVRDMRMMDQMGLAGGGRLSNVVLIDDEKVVNPPLRFPDEFARHKVLDIIGDFYLLGRPMRAKIIARQTGHTENIAMLRLLNETMGIL